MPVEIEQAREARRRLEKVCDRLLNPSAKAFDACAPDLGRAVECLRRLEMALGASPPGFRGKEAVGREIMGLSDAVRKAHALLEASGKFYAGLARLIDASPETAVPSYTSSGKSLAAVSIDRGRVAIDG